MKIEQASSSAVAELWWKIEPQVVAAEYLEEGAQHLTAAFYDQFSESIALTRVFVTVPFGKLPPANRQYVQKLAESAGVAADLKETTPVHSLIGSYGWDEMWRDRRRSEGHVGIPLVSSAFIAAIPMMSRLLKEFGVPLDWVDSHDSEMIIDTIGSEAGLFFVEDAATTVNSKGKHIITAQDFVAKHGIKSVFGVGGAYANGQFAVNLTFCRDRVSRDAAERFVTLAAFFISKTGGQVERGRIFRD